MMIRAPYRGDGSHRPADVPLPPAQMPLLWNWRMLKLWRYVSIWSRDLSICAARVHVGPIPQEFWAVWDRKNGKLYEHTRLLGVGRVDVPVGHVRVEDGTIRVDVTLDEGPHFEVVTFDERAYTWTGKQCGIRAHGSVQINGESRPVEAVALIDNNAGYHRRHTRWYWSGGVGQDVQGRAVAWSVIVGLNDSPVNSERTVWVDGAAREVGPVQFAEDLTGVTFADGGHLHFTEEAARQRQDNLLVIRSVYRQPFGAFSGTLPGGIELREAYGVMEFHEALW